MTPFVDEQKVLEELKTISEKNSVWKNYIGLGYYNCTVPAAILRNVFENVGW